MAKVLAESRKLVCLLPNLRAMTARIRCFSSYRQQQQSASVYDEQQAGVGSDWPDGKLGFLTPPDKSFPLPGNVGASTQLKPPEVCLPVELNIKTLPTAHEKQVIVMEQFFLSDEGKAMTEQSEQSSKSIENVLECIAVECPKKLKKGFMELFPEAGIGNDGLTVITLCQKTVNDMSGWSPAVEEERNDLTDYFMAGAQEICDLLKSEGFWADFIDPSSGLAFYGRHTNINLFETDERYQSLGFDIIDLGCCKVISHHVWGTHAFVGSLFTNAPTDSTIMRQIMQSLHKD
ncbi:cobalamin trafficking protein CblD-like [Glandiceps talaboti]